MTRILGLDLSLTCTGWATLDTLTGRHTTGTLEVRTRDPYHRLRHLRTAVGSLLSATPPDVVTVEGYSYGSTGAAVTRLAELGAIIRVHLLDTRHPFHDVPPATLKRYATGKGNAPKTAVFAAAIRRLAYTGTSTDEADALWLAHLGAHLTGEPRVTLPAAHLTFKPPQEHTP